MTGSLLDLAVLGTTFGVIFLAELPDKTALASLVLGTRYRPGPVFAGVAAAFAVHVVLAIVAGSLLGLLPHRTVALIVAVLFAVGAVLLLLRRRDDHEPGGGDRDGKLADSAGPQADPTATPQAGAHGDTAHRRQRKPARAGPAATSRDGLWRVAATSFAVLFVAEFGDLTQVAIANLAARYHQPISVGIGALAGMWSVGALAVFGGRQLMRLVPVAWINRAAAAVMITLAVLSLLDAIAA
jgi:putative Ca2+/H+ antiporter (TMEM165/GDT1 family)